MSSAAELDMLLSPRQLLLPPRPPCPTLSFAQGRATRVCLGLCPLGLGDVAAGPDAPVPGSDGRARAQPFAQGLLCLAGPGKQREKEPQTRRRVWELLAGLETPPGGGLC